MPYFYFDYSYLVLIPAMIFALVAQAMVSSAFNKYNNVRTGCSMTGADAARLILDRNGLHHVKIEQIAGNLTDHFDPRTNVIRLSGLPSSLQMSLTISMFRISLCPPILYTSPGIPLWIMRSIALQ
ncbi:MAG: zinc metallopeptidase, partial [Clostridia bacterium]|nr:zinc metallopeptidase [Clostridia bacterium]